MQKSIDYIEDNLDKDLNVNKIARVCGYSTYHFIKLFAEYTGLTPIKYVRRRRLNEVTNMKAAGLTFYDAAAKFNTSASALARAFKEEYNCTLSEFLNNEVEIELQKRIKVVEDSANWSDSMNNVEWSDKQHKSYYCHSYPAALFSVIKQQNNEANLADILGYSGFAFRIDMHKNLCPSATSIFDWNSELGFAVSNCGYKYSRIQRLWDKYNDRDEIRGQAISRIKSALKNNKLPICWDLIIPEWSLVVGYDPNTDSLLCVGPNNMRGALKANLLGQREIELLDVTILESANDLPKEKRFESAIKWAIKHGNGELWTNRPAYEQGLKAWDMWQEAVDNFHNIESDNKFFACSYHANMIGSARLAAARFIERNCQDSKLLRACEAYRKISTICFYIVDIFEAGKPSITDLVDISSKLKQAKEHEEKALSCLVEWLSSVNSK